MGVEKIRKGEPRNTRPIMLHGGGSVTMRTAPIANMSKTTNSMVNSLFELILLYDTKG